MTSSPKVSVIIPTHNRRHTLERALHSVREQTFKNYEIIVVDDGSTDGTQERLEKHVDRSLRYFRHDENRGASEARNTGIREAEGKFIAFLDSDDEWKKKKLERQVQRLEGGAEDVGLVYTGLEIEGSTDREPSRISPSKRGNIYRDQLFRDWILPTSTWLVKKKCFDDVGDFNKKLRAREDYEMNLRICEHYRVDFIDEVLTVKHNSGEDRVSKKIPEKIKAHKRIIREVIGPRVRKLSRGKPARVFAVQYFNLARECQKLAEFDEARKIFKESLAWNPIYLKAWVCLLFTLFNQDLPRFYYKISGA